MSKFSFSRNIFFFLRLSDVILVCFLMGLERLSIFYNTTCIMVAWNLVNSFIFSSAFWAF